MKITKNIIELFRYFLNLSLIVFGLSTLILLVHLILVSMGFLVDKSEFKFDINVTEQTSFLKGEHLTAFQEGYNSGHDSSIKYFGSHKSTSDSIKISAYKPHALVSYDLSYELDGLNYPSAEIQNEISTISIKDDSYRGRLLKKIFLFFTSLLLLFIAYELWMIFGILKHAKQTNDWFSRRIYKALFIIPFYYLALISIDTVSDIIYSAMLDNITINDFKQYTSIQFPSFTNLITCVFLFIISQVYKAGVVMREEQDLII
ncbi:MAG: DUF2975 domain-containing protein [Marinifilaceae bacterium]